MQVLLEIRVIALDHRQAQRPGEAEPLIVRDERRLDVNEIEVALAEPRRQATNRACLHEAIFGIARQVARGNADDLAVGACIANWILRRDEQRLVAGGVQSTPKGLDGGGDAVDPRKVDIRDHQYAHAGSRESKFAAAYCDQMTGG